MKVVQINSVCGRGSTGKICVSVSELLTEKDIENYIFYASGTTNYALGRKYMSDMDVKVQTLVSRVFGNYGFEARRPTRRLMKMMDEVSPDVVHLHNLHGHNVHLGLLLSYFKNKKIKVYWTFHDCWAFTSYCMYFDMVHCTKWKSECKNCPQCRKYSWIFDRSRWIFNKKKSLLTGVDLTVITPSKWLADLAKQSFLKDIPIQVIHNGIDLSVFSPRTSDFRKNYNIPEDKIVLLGVANKWEKRKGLDVFVKLSEMLDHQYQIVLVGTNSTVDRQLPSNIISIHRTSNQIELAEIYSSADFFVNPTREDNFPTVNIEALACGTPVITFATGGSPEALSESCGCVVPCDDVEGIVSAVESKSAYSAEQCRIRATDFNQTERFKEYLQLYLSVEV